MTSKFLHSMYNKTILLDSVFVISRLIKGLLPFTPSIRVEILRVNIQCCSLSKRKMGKSQNVPVSIGKFKKKRKNVLIKLVAYNFLNVSSGMVCTISICNQNFRVFRVNGKRPRSH